MTGEKLVDLKRLNNCLLSTELSRLNYIYVFFLTHCVFTVCREKRADLKDHGGGRLLQEVLGFFLCKDKGLAIKIAREGVRVNRYQNGCLGNLSLYNLCMCVCLW